MRQPDKPPRQNLITNTRLAIRWNEFSEASSLSDNDVYVIKSKFEPQSHKVRKVFQGFPGGLSIMAVKKNAQFNFFEKLLGM